MLTQTAKHRGQCPPRGFTVKETQCVNKFNTNPKQEIPQEFVYLLSVCYALDRQTDGQTNRDMLNSIATFSQCPVLVPRRGSVTK